jgi:hypothetical protein
MVFDLWFCRDNRVSVRTASHDQGRALITLVSVSCAQEQRGVKLHEQAALVRLGTPLSVPRPDMLLPTASSSKPMKIAIDSCR